jgi:hypothetical protein
MSDLETIWGKKSDETLLEAGKDLGSFSSEAIDVILEEHRRRGLPIPAIPQTTKIPDSPLATIVLLTGVDMPFHAMASLIFKWSLATIPTALFWFVMTWLLLKIK